MAWVAVAGAAIAAAPSVYKAIKGNGQTNAANAMHPVNPGYQMNKGLIDNARTITDQYNNYTLPGYSTMKGNIDTNFQNAFDAGEQGATSGADVLDLATRMAYGKNQAYNQLGQQNAEGKRSMLSSYLDANSEAGQQFVDKGRYDREQYNEQLKEKAALTQAGAENTYSAFDQLAGTASKYAFSQASTPGADDGTTMGQKTNAPTLSSVSPTSDSLGQTYDPVTQTYKKWFQPSQQTIPNYSFN